MENNKKGFTDHLKEKLISSFSLAEMMSAVLEKGNQLRIQAKGVSMSPFHFNLDYGW